MLPAVNGTDVDTLAPIIRVAVDHTGFVELSQQTTSDYPDPYMLGGVQVTAADVARGYVDIQSRGDIAPDRYDIHFKSDTDVPSDAATPAIAVTGDPHITQATDDVGPSQGMLADHSVTDDPTPTLRLSLAQSKAAVGAVVRVLEGQTNLGEVTLTSDDVSRGYVDVTTSALANGVHHLQTMLPTSVFPHPSYYDFTVDVEASAASAAGGQVITASCTPDTLTGGSGDDTSQRQPGARPAHRRRGPRR